MSGNEQAKPLIHGRFKRQNKLSDDKLMTNDKTASKKELTHKSSAYPAKKAEGTHSVSTAFLPSFLR